MFCRFPEMHWRKKILVFILVYIYFIRFSPHPPKRTTCVPVSCPCRVPSIWMGQTVMEMTFGLRSLRRTWQRWPWPRNFAKCRYRYITMPSNVYRNNSFNFLYFIIRSRPVISRHSWMRRSWRIASCCSRFPNLRNSYLWCHKSVTKKMRLNFLTVVICGFSMIEIWYSKKCVDLLPLTVLFSKLFYMPDAVTFYWAS